MAAEHASGAEPNIGETIIHHISNGEAIIPIRIPIGSYTLDLSVTKAVLMLWIVAAIVVVLYTWLARRLKAAEDGAPKGTFTTMLEFFVSAIREQIVLPFIGPKYTPRFLPLILTFFTFILMSNLLGLTPIVDVIGHVGEALHIESLGKLAHGSSTATGNFNVTAGLALITFFSIIYAGSVRTVPCSIGRTSSLTGLNPFIYVILIPIEVIGMFVKPFALTMRLAANMTAGHAAILAIMSFIFVFQQAAMGIVSVPLMTGLLLLEIIVCFVQAYVFTLLSALFIGMAIHVHH
jgi:F-type H+-transporting ATPase subunit a